MKNTWIAWIFLLSAKALAAPLSVELEVKTSCQSLTGEAKTLCMGARREALPPEILTNLQLIAPVLLAPEQKGAVGAGYIGIGLDAAVAPKAQVFNLPLSYMLNLGSDAEPYFTTFGVLLPLQRFAVNPKTGEEATTYGLGNVGVTVGLNMGSESTLRNEGEAILILPTDALGPKRTSLFLGYTARKYFFKSYADEPLRFSLHMDYGIDVEEGQAFSLWQNNTLQFWGEVLGAVYDNLKARASLGVRMVPVADATDLRAYDLHLGVIYKAPLDLPLFGYLDTLVPLTSTTPNIERHVVVTMGVRTML